MDLSSTLGERISTIIKETVGKNVTFAERLGVDQSYVSQLRSGKRTPSERTLRDICSTFGYSEEWLRNGRGPKRDPNAAPTLPTELTSSPVIRAILESYLELGPEGRKAFDEFFDGFVRRYKGLPDEDSAFTAAAAGEDAPSAENHS